MNELIIKSFLINTFALINILPAEIKKLSDTTNQEVNSALFKKTLQDIEEFHPLFTRQAFKESFDNTQKLNTNECNIYLTALEDKFQNITKTYGIIAKHDPLIIERIELLKNDLLTNSGV